MTTDNDRIMESPVDIVNFWLIFDDQYCCTSVEHLCLIKTMCHLVHWLLNDTFGLENRSATRCCIKCDILSIRVQCIFVSLMYNGLYSRLCSDALQRVNKGSKTESCVIACLCFTIPVYTLLSASFSGMYTCYSRWKYC